MIRNYLYNNATYNVVLPNYQDEVLRNILFNLFRNGKVDINNPADFFDSSVEVDPIAVKGVIANLYNSLTNENARKVSEHEEGYLEQITISVGQNVETTEETPVEPTVEKKTRKPRSKKEENTTEVAPKKRGRKKKSE